MVTPYWYPVRGGVTTYVSQLSDALRSAGHEVQVLAREGGESGARVLGGTAAEFARRAAEVLSEVGPDLVHAHGHWYALAAGLRFRRRRRGCRVVFTAHTAFPDQSWLRRHALSRMLSQADALTAVSADLLGQVLRAYRPTARTRVTRAGVSTKPAIEAENLAFLRSHGLEGRKPLIGFLGPLSWEEKVRGVEQLIRAMPSIRKAVPTATLMIGGDGPHRQRLEALAVTHAPESVVFLGDLPDPVPKFFAVADVYAHVSYQEGLPVALLEAMACGCPVVASAIGGIPEVVQDGLNGLFTTNEPSDLAVKVVRVLTDPELRGRLTRNAKQDIAAEFSWSKAAPRFLEIYGERTAKQVVVTVDLEKDYHTPGKSFRGVDEALPRLLDLLDRHGIRATFFATADLAATRADALREIVRRGHSLGCHGESHDVEYLGGRSWAWQRESLTRATESLAAAIGIRPTGFRAPNFSADGATVRVLEELGYRYDSSVLPGRVVGRLRKRLDFLSAPRDPYHPSRDDPALPGNATLWELPVTENPFAAGGPIGLGYVNVEGPDRAIDAVACAIASPVVFLIHPWEFVDPPPGRIPSWMRTGCTSNPAALDAFLNRLRAEHTLTTFDAVLA